MAIRGALSFMHRGIKKILSPFIEFGSVVFFVRDLQQDGPASTLPADVSVRRVPPGEVPGLQLRPDSESPAVRRAIESSLRSGARFYAVFDREGRPRHTRWVTHGRAHIPELGMDFVPPAGEAYFFDGFTHPEARGRGLDGIMRGFIFETLRAEGGRRAWSYVRGDNDVGLKAALSRQRRHATLRYIRLRGRERARVFGLRGSGLADRLERVGGPTAPSGAARERAWRLWFEDFADRPLAKRSTGYDALPDEYFDSAARYVIAALRLDPASDVVLDLGCDSAMLTRRIAPRCKWLVGADFILGQVRDSKRQGATCASGRPAEFLAGDARSLPFAPRTFTKAYCTGTIHTLATHEDAVRVIDELVRVCRPGGEVLLGALPARAKRRAAVRRAWRTATTAERWRIAGAFVVPKSLRDLARRVLPFARRGGIVSLEFDLVELKAMLERAGLACRIADFPADYWSRNFRETRSNLLISVPRKPVAVLD